MLKKAGPDGMSKVVNEFNAKYPEYSKRQTEMKIFEVAKKEKQAEDTKQIWHIRPDFEHFLYMENFATGDGERSSASKSKSQSKDKATKDTSNGSTSAKRKRDDDSSPITKNNKEEGSSASSAAAGKEPKKYKRAFGFFVKAKRPEAEKRIGDSSVSAVILLS